MCTLNYFLDDEMFLSGESGHLHAKSIDKTLRDDEAGVYLQAPGRGHVVAWTAGVVQSEQVAYHVADRIHEGDIMILKDGGDYYFNLFIPWCLEALTSLTVCIQNVDLQLFLQVLRTFSWER